MVSLMKTLWPLHSCFGSLSVSVRLQHGRVGDARIVSLQPSIPAKPNQNRIATHIYIYIYIYVCRSEFGSSNRVSDSSHIAHIKLTHSSYKALCPVKGTPGSF